MKRITVVLLMLGLASLVNAQNNIELQLYPKYDGQDLVLNQVYSDENGNDFRVTRFEYYIHGFTLLHDGGQSTSFTGESSYILADANSVAYSLGTGNINTVEGIAFDVGVESGLNHNDPSLYAPSHPLAPQNPSMHWGWAAGYRFLALEIEVDADGNGSMETLMQSHVVGDSYLRSVSSIGISNSLMIGNTVIVALNYDLENWLTGLNLATFGVNHGGGSENQAIMDNIDPENVFSEGVATGIEDNVTLDAKVFAADGNINYSSEDVIEQVEIYELGGKLLYTEKLQAKQGVITPNINNQGIYLVKLFSGIKTMTAKLNL